jgi:hypothetical protein
VKTYDVKSALSSELVRQGLAPADADMLAAVIAPDLTSHIQSNIQPFTKDNAMVTMFGAVVSIANLQTRIIAEFPATALNKQGIYTTAEQLIRKNPTWGEDQVYAELRKYFMPSTAGGTQRSITELLALQQQRQQQTILVIGGIAVAAVVIWNLMRRRRAA